MAERKCTTRPEMVQVVDRKGTVRPEMIRAADHQVMPPPEIHILVMEQAMAMRLGMVLPDMMSTEVMDRTATQAMKAGTNPGIRFSMEMPGCMETLALVRIRECPGIRFPMEMPGCQEALALEGIRECPGIRFSMEMLGCLATLAQEEMQGTIARPERESRRPLLRILHSV